MSVVGYACSDMAQRRPSREGGIRANIPAIVRCKPCQDLVSCSPGRPEAGGSRYFEKGWWTVMGGALKQERGRGKGSHRGTRVFQKEGRCFHGVSRSD